MTVELAKIECRVYRAPVETPVQTSFGIMHDRPVVLVHATDRDGVSGWGEVWCNFPSVGAEHRARLLRDIVAPAACETAFSAPAELFNALTRRFEVLAIQAGEHGPLAQAIAGLDIAVWDLAARRAGTPLYRFLGGAAARFIPAYASGLNPDRPERLAERMREKGHHAFKLKVGFGAERDLANLRALRDLLGKDAGLMVDANQAWDFDTAKKMAKEIDRFTPAWLEEPIRADRPTAEWGDLARSTGVPLAAGENMRGADFDRTIEARHLGVIQPDIGKWGGFSRCVDIGRRALAQGMRFCPHWLGGGLGLLASTHLLAAVGGDGLVEIDSNPNPLREAMLDRPWRIEAGRLAVPEGPGLGATPDLEAIAHYEVSF